MTMRRIIPIPLTMPRQFHHVCTILTLLLVSQTAVSSNGSVTANSGSNFTIVNGQVFTPGLVILDSPQPFTPMGGDTLNIAIDISGDGQLPLGLPSTSPTLFHNITIFLTSYTTIHNFTISNGTTPTNTSTSNTTSFIGPILSLEPSSTVKHINFPWPACLVGNGAPSLSEAKLGTGEGSARGEYNISIHQSFRLNGSEFYTVFDLPISVTNSIPSTHSGGQERVECPFLENILLPMANVTNSTNTLREQPFLGGRVSISGTSKTGKGSGSNPFGIPSGAKEGDGDLTALLAEAGGRLRWSTGMMLLVGAAVVILL